ncbi:hypothetical protein E5288_WYG010052 [Bos mutus]|uniref:Signal peptidase complex subunit 1 n=1 Tax=Bos mutus TaxID=72004 RepID=A0A6B0RYC6_9CETA|nr:hypothetical protein [Bos mutus]
MLEHLSSLPTQMDYKGQKLAEQMFQGIILFSVIVGFIYGPHLKILVVLNKAVSSGNEYGLVSGLKMGCVHQRPTHPWTVIPSLSVENYVYGNKNFQCCIANNSKAKRILLSYHPTAMNIHDLKIQILIVSTHNMWKDESEAHFTAVILSLAS